MQRLGEREVRNAVAEVRMHEITTVFFLPKYASANRPDTPDPGTSTPFNFIIRPIHRDEPKTCLPFVLENSF